MVVIARRIVVVVLSTKETLVFHLLIISADQQLARHTTKLLSRLSLVKITSAPSPAAAYSMVTATSLQPNLVLLDGASDEGTPASPELTLLREMLKSVPW